MYCPGDYIHRDNEVDKLFCYPLNPDLISYFRSIGIDLLFKIGEGRSADVFQVVINNEKDAALILQSNIDNVYDFSDKLEIAKKFPDIFPVIYMYFTVDIPYSLDPDYLKNSDNFNNRIIQVIELMDMTLDKYLITMAKIMGKDIIPIINTLEQILTNHLQKMNNNGIYYTDVKLNNICINSDSGIVKFIDIEGIHLGQFRGYDPTSSIHDLINYEIIPLIYEYL